MQALEADASDWARRTAIQLRQRSPLMLHVTLEHIRRARGLTLAQDLRMERDVMRHCFFPRHLGRGGRQTEAAEGIRALAVDKDNAPAGNRRALKTSPRAWCSRFLPVPGRRTAIRCAR